MQAGLIVALYLGDEILSSLMPFSSGSFAVALVLMLAAQVRIGPATAASILACSVAALLLGTVGALLSRTPVTAFSAASIVLLAALWATASGLRGKAAALITPLAAFVGVMVSAFFLALSMFGLDAYTVLSGNSSSRSAGLFQEPSHLALYVMPLWLIAFQRRHWRPWLVAALFLMVFTHFSSTLVAIALIAVALHTLLGRSRHDAGRRVVQAVLAALVTATLPLLMSVDGVPVQEYLGSRLGGLFLTDETDMYNLSSLVVLQGLELARLSFNDSYGLGVGLGNMGTSLSVLEQSAYRALINNLTTGNIDLNLRDGGLLVSKIVGELGVLSLGVALLFWTHLRRLGQLRDDLSRNYHLSFAALLLSLVFVRALPYFAAPTCLAIASLAALRRTPREFQRGSPAKLPSARTVQG